MPEVQKGIRLASAKESEEKMRPPKGLTVKFDYMDRERVYFKIRATKFYLFKVIMKIAWQNIQKPILSFLIVVFAFYYLVRDRQGSLINQNEDRC